MKVDFFVCGVLWVGLLACTPLLKPSRPASVGTQAPSSPQAPDQPQPTHDPTRTPPVAPDRSSLVLPPETTWQWQLKGALKTDADVQVYDVDLFDVSAEQMQRLKAQGRRVICYMSVGTWEDWRPDKADFAAKDIGRDFSGWAGEKFLDTRSEGVRQAMRKRLDLAQKKGCFGVEPDNIDSHSNDTGFPVTLQPPKGG